MVVSFSQWRHVSLIIIIIPSIIKFIYLLIKGRQSWKTIINILFFFKKVIGYTFNYYSKLQFINNLHYELTSNYVKFINKKNLKQHFFLFSKQNVACLSFFYLFFLSFFFNSSPSYIKFLFVKNRTKVLYYLSAKHHREIYIL